LSAYWFAITIEISNGLPAVRATVGETDRLTGRKPICAGPRLCSQYRAYDGCASSPG
jgi:hypothetical protein